MPEDDKTPVNGHWIDIMRAELAKHHDRINEMRSIQIENCGRDGRNGKLYQVIGDVVTNQQSIKINQDAIQQLMQRQEKQSVKLTLLVTAAATVATMLGGALFRLIGG